MKIEMNESQAMLSTECLLSQCPVLFIYFVFFSNINVFYSFVRPQIKLNHRKLLDGILDICGVPPEKFGTICSSIDKLDKQSLEQIKEEMVSRKFGTICSIYFVMYLVLI